MRQCPKCGTKFWGDSERQCPNDGATLQDVVVTSDRTRLLGAVIHGRYQIEGVLGDGGMGVVYRARGIQDQRPYAVKVLRAEYTHEEELVARFEVEARAVAAVRHPNIVQVFEFGALEDSSRFFVMEHLDGKSLAVVMHNAGKLADGHRRPLDARLALKITRQICAGLGAAHAAGIVHRDMKPDNVHIVRDANDPSDATFVKILDFGIAKVAGSQAAKTRTGSVFGTPQYMSPEQAAGERDIDARTDVYATGILLYEMVTGQLPFESDNLMAILAAHMYQPPIRPRTIPAAAKNVDAALESVLMKALAKDRSLRYQSMADFSAELERIQNGLEPLALDDAEPTVIQDGRRGSLMPPPIAPAPVHSTGSSPQATISPVTMNPRPAPRTSAISPIALVLGAVGLLSFVGAGAMIVRRSRNRAPSIVDVSEPNVPVVQPALLQPVPTGPAGQNSQTVLIETTPAGAELSLDGRTVICSTPCAVARPSNTAVRYLVNAAGFERSTFDLRPDSAPHIQLMLPTRNAPRTGVNTAATARTQPRTQPSTGNGNGGTVNNANNANNANGGNGAAGRNGSPLLHPWE